MLANILQILFYVLLMVIMFGESIFQTMGMACPDFVKSMGESKLMYSIGAFFVFAQISTSLRSTGAFEVTINDNLVFSKLESGKMIDGPTLNSMFEPYGVSFMQRRAHGGRP